MKLRSGKEVSIQSEELECDSEKRSTKVLKAGQKGKETCEVINPVSSETIHSSSVNEDSDDSCPAGPSNGTGTETVVMKHLGHISCSPDAPMNLPTKSHSNTDTNNEVLVCTHQALPSSSSHFVRSSKDKPANVAPTLSSLHSSEMCPSSSSNIGCLMKDNSPLIVDVTNIRKGKTKKKRSVCSVVNSIICKESESIAMVHESDNFIPKIPSVKQKFCGRSVEVVPQNAKAKKGKAGNMPILPVPKEKCKGQEDDACSVISLGSDDDDEDVIILDSEPKPQLDCSSSSDIVILDTPPSEKCVPTSDPLTVNLCTPLSQSNINPKSHGHRKHKIINRKDKTMNRRIKSKICKKSAFKDYVSVLSNVPHTTDTRPEDMPRVPSDYTHQSYMPFATDIPSRSVMVPAIDSNNTNAWSCTVIASSSTVEYNQRSVATAYSSSSQYPDTNAMRMCLQPINNQLDLANVRSSNVFGNNFYNPNPANARVGLRPVVIDGSNVAMG
jgi:hypothetical protein